jgi:5-(carboxyamino)imidazole ribonucleotide synthase
MHIGIIGCGQLARMMAQAGQDLSLEFSFLASEGEATRCVQGLGAVARHTAGSTAEEVYRALGEPDVITVEREHVDVGLLEALTVFCRVAPDPGAVRTCGNRALEKQLFTSLGLDTANYRIAHTPHQVTDAAHALGMPVVVKATTAGYDGKQQWRLHDEEQLRTFCLEQRSGDWLVESKIPFEREISIIAARSANGDVAVYPPTENRHQDGILITSIAPAADLPPNVLAAGDGYIRRLLTAMDYVGVLAMECFVTAEGLLINELAPRVHNSGHWTLRSEATSQFENHLRAILGMQLGSTRVSRYDGIINILGRYDREQTVRALSSDSALIDYNKSFAPQRKLGHINVSRASREDIVAELGRLHHCLYADSERTHASAPVPPAG